MPEALEYLWDWFCRLCGQRHTALGPAPLSYPAIESFFRLLGTAPLPWELELLERLDGLWLAAVRAKTETGKDKGREHG